MFEVANKKHNLTKAVQEDKSRLNFDNNPHFSINKNSTLQDFVYQSSTMISLPAHR